jgi:hypothetical protein
VDIRCSVHPRSGNPRRQRIIDLSALGAWLQTRKPLAAGELIELHFEADQEAVALRAEVMWTRNRGRGAGMAVEFVSLDAQTRGTLAAMLDSAPPAAADDARFAFANAY